MSIAELLIVAGIAGLLGTVMVSLCRPMLAASQAEHVSLLEVQTMDSTLYRLQRDARQTDPNGVFDCDGSGSAVRCYQASTMTSPTNVQCLAILTARPNGSGSATWDSSGRPAWVGFSVYWLVADQSGTYTLMNGFGPANVAHGANVSILNGDVSAAVTQAMAATNATTVALGIEQLQSMVDVTTDRVAIRLAGFAQSGGSKAELSVVGDAYARN